MVKLPEKLSEQLSVKKRMADLISFLLRDGLEYEIPKIAADEKLRETYYHKYQL